MRKAVKAIMLSSSCTALALAGLVTASQNEGAVRDAILARQEALQSVEASFHLAETFTGPGILGAKLAAARRPNPRVPARSDSNVSRMSVHRGDRKWQCLFRYLDGRAYYENRRTEPPEAITMPAHLYRIFAFSRSRTESSWRTVGEPIDGGVIWKEHPIPTDAVIDTALGLRAHGETAWLAVDVWKTLDLEDGEGGTVRLIRPGHLAGYPDIRTDVWTFDPAVGYALVRYEMLVRGKLAVELKNSDFRGVDQLQLPYRIQWRSLFTHAPEPTETASRDLHVETYRLNELEDSDDPFLINWPDGAVVYDARTDKQFTVRNGPRKLDDEDVQTYMETGQLPPPPKPSDLRLWITGVSLLVLGTVTAVALFRRRFAR